MVINGMSSRWTDVGSGVKGHNWDSYCSYYLLMTCLMLLPVQHWLCLNVTLNVTRLLTTILIACICSRI